jgi:hypothetical protein
VSGGFRHDIAGGQGNLVAEILQSPNFKHDVSGWQVTKLGGAEFNSITIRGTTILSGSMGVFVYSGTPSLGNLIASITDASSDSFGNPTEPGITAYQSGLWIQLAGGVTTPLLEANTGAAGNVALQGSSITGANLVVSPMPIWVSSTFLSGLAFLAEICGGGNAPSFDPVIFDSGIVALAPGSDVGSAAAETWHPMTLLNGWINAAGFAPAQYRLSVENEVKITGVISATGATSTIFAKLPTGYIPGHEQGYAIGNTGGAPAGTITNVRVDTSGNLSVADAAAVPAADSYFINGRIYLDA